MKKLTFLKMGIVFTVILALTACAVYTEKRSEVLSQSVYAAADGIEKGRIELAYKYAQEAKKIAYPPKERISIPEFKTKSIKKVESVSGLSNPVSTSKQDSNSPLKTNIITSTFNNGEEETVLRLVIPEFLKEAKLLIENSAEWNELMKVKEHKEMIEKDNARLNKLKADLEKELEKQRKYNDKMVIALNELQKSVIKKDLHILKLYIIIALLVAAIGGGVYLRMKGIL